MADSRSPAARPRRDRAGHPIFVALDFGTSHIKAAVGHSAGAPIASASSPVTYVRRPGDPDTALEFESETVWQAACRVVRKALNGSALKPSHIAGIGVTSQRLGLVLYDGEGREVYAGPNRDARAVFEGAEIDATLGAELWRATGHGPAMLLAWSKLDWLRKNRPNDFGRVRAANTPADWLVFRMTGVMSIDQSLGVESGLGLVATGLPASVFKEPLGFHDLQLPPMIRPGTVAGTLKSGPAGQIGLPAGIPVVTCGPDTQAGLAGLGVSEPGSVGVIAGWSASTQMVTAAPVIDDTRSMWTGRHVVPGRWTLEANAGDMGGAYQWLLSLLAGGRSDKETFARSDRLAARVEPGARGASAFLGPSFVNMSAAGLRTGGLLFPVPLSFEPPDRDTLVRATIENFGFAVRYNVDRIGLATGGWEGVACGGGMAQTATFRRVVAACLGRPTGFGTAGDATMRGALSLTGAGTGEGQTLDRALEARRRELAMVEPGAVEAAQYQDLYDAWRLRERRLGDFEV